MAHPAAVLRFRVGRGPASARFDPVIPAITNAIARLILIKAGVRRPSRSKRPSRAGQERNSANVITGGYGLTSVARPVAFATNLLILTADGVLSGTHSHSYEQLIVTSNEVGRRDRAAHCDLAV